MELVKKDFKIFPKFRHNLWTNYKDAPEITYLTVSHGTYEVSTEDANKFLKIRSFSLAITRLQILLEKAKCRRTKFN